MSSKRLKLLWVWLGEGKYVWLALVVVGIACGVCLRPGTSEPLVRLVGLVLQVLGIGTVIWGIAETRSLFSHKPALAAVRDWFSRNPLRSRTVTVAAAGALASGSATMGGEATHSRAAGRSVEERLDALESNITAIHERIGVAERELEQSMTRTKDALSSEAVIRAAEDIRVSRMLESSATGGVHISAIGATWLFLGVVLSTAAAELSAWLR